MIESMEIKMIIDDYHTVIAEYYGSVEQNERGEKYGEVEIIKVELENCHGRRRAVAATAALVDVIENRIFEERKKNIENAKVEYRLNCLMGA